MSALRIKNTTIKITKGDIKKIKADRRVDRLKGRMDQNRLRAGCRAALVNAHKGKARSIAFSDLGSIAAGFPPVGAAKIMGQEVLKFLQWNTTTIKEVIFCLEQGENFKIFEDTITGYIKHIQENLGRGPYVTVDVIIELPQGIVLIERSNPPYGWALPGGFVDYGESLEEAAVREAKEETNLDLKNLRQLHTYSQPNRDPRFHTISTVFVGQGVGKPKSGDDAKGLKVVSCTDLLKWDYAFDHKMVIRNYLLNFNGK